MAATNFTPIQLYYSTTASAAPVAANLANGELAINITDGKLFYKDNGGTVQVLATKATGTIGGSNTQVQYNNAGVLAGSANFTFDGTTATINTLNLTTVLDETYGGTGNTSYTTGDLLYASASNTLSKLTIGTNGYILTSNGTTPTWTAGSSISVNTADNLSGGATGSVPYQSAAGATTFLGIGAANRVLTSSGTAPQWVTSLTGLTGVSSSGLTNTSLTSGRVVYSTTGGAQTDSASLTFNGTTLTAAGLASTGASTLDKLVKIGDTAFNLPAVLSATAPAKLYVSTATVTDASSAAGATNVLGTIASLGSTTVAASNTGVTYTNLATLYIAGAPTAGTNVTITNPYSLYVAGGASYFGGAVTYGAGLTLGGNLLFSPDNTYDIGGVGVTRPQSGYFGTTLWVGASSISSDSLNAAGMRIGAGTFKQQYTAGFDFQQYYTAAGQTAPDAAIAVDSGVYRVKVANAVQTTLTGTLYTVDKAMTVNESGGNYDFRAESQGSTHMLFVDASANAVGINDSLPHVTLAVDGVIGSQFYSNYGGNGVDDPFGRKFNWTMGNSGNVGSTWRKIAVITLPDASFSSLSLQVVTINPGSNYGVYTNPEQRWINQASITRKVGATVVDTAYAYGPLNSSRLRLHRNSVGEWELQANAGGDNEAVMYEVTLLTSGGGASIASVEGQIAGTTGGTIVQFDGTRAFNENISGLTTYAGAVFNAGLGDNDFRVAGDNYSHLIFADASVDMVGIRTSSPDYPLTVDGEINVGSSGANLGVLIVPVTSSALPSSSVKSRITTLNSGFGYAAGSLYLQPRTGVGAVLAIGTNGVERASFGDGEIVFNESSNDVDFRVESDGNTHMLFVDAGNNTIGVMTNAPTAPLEINSIGGLGGYTALKVKFGSSSVQSLSMGQVTAGNGGWLGTAQYRSAGNWQTEGTAASILGMGSDGTMTLYTNSGLTANTDFNPTARLTLYTTSAVVNEDGNNYDFRVESDGNAYMLYVSGAGNSVGVACDAPTVPLQVGNGVGSGAQATYPGWIQINTSAAGGLNGDGGLEFKAASAGSGYGWKITSYDSFSTGVHFAIGNRESNSSWTQQFMLNQSGFCQIPYIYSYTTGSAANVFVDSAGTLYRSTSSLKYKKDVQDYTRGLLDLMKLRPVFYKGTGPNDDGHQYAGLISEEVEAAGMTEFVDYGADGQPEGLYYQHMVALLTKAIQELKSEFDAYKASHP